MINRSRSRLRLLVLVLLLVMITGYHMRLIRFPRQSHPEWRKRRRRRKPRAIAPNMSMALTMTTTKHAPICTGYKRTRCPGERGRRGSWRCCCHSGRRRLWPIRQPGPWRCGVEPRRWGEEEAVMIIVVVASTDERLGLSLVERSSRRGSISSGNSWLSLLDTMRSRNSPIIIHTRMT